MAMKWFSTPSFKNGSTLMFWRICLICRIKFIPLLQGNTVTTPTLISSIITNQYPEASYEQHMRFHYDHLEHTLHRPDVKIKSAQQKRTDAFRDKARKKSLEKRELFSKNAKKQWKIRLIRLICSRNSWNFIKAPGLSGPQCSNLESGAEKLLVSKRKQIKAV